MKYFPSLLIPLLLFAGCSKSDFDKVPEHLAEIQNVTIYDSQEKAQFDIDINQTQLYEESDELKFGRISDIAVDQSEKVYISEFTQGHVGLHVFANDGSYLTSVGGYGDGPGEFRSAINPQINDEYLYVFDTRQLKINAYSIQTFSIERSIKLDRQNWSHIEELGGASPYDFTVLDSDRILMTFLKSEGRKDLLLRYMMNNSGEIISDKIVEQVSAEHFIRPDNGGIWFSPFSSSGLMAITDNKNLYTVWTEDILFKKHTLDGQYQSSFYHPFSNKELSRDEVLNYSDSEIYKASVRNTGFPENLPAVNSVVVDDLNNFWISTIIENENEYRWWILNSNGEVLSRFLWPKNSAIRVVKNESIYTIETASDTGIQKVVKYNFDYE